ncbi:MAG: TonB-dependent receptor [Bacteroidales bacterium]|nr:TonB-dependent receptor [Bacteroidales bacterium]MBN2699039.1 TonB-dependent receptor [Bacteroidales bacterium]
MNRKNASFWKFVIILVLFIPFNLLAQVITVTGKVTDSNTGEALPGVTIIARGTTLGAVTDFDGNYTITVVPSATLVFSYVGYATQEVQVNNQTTIDIQLAEETTELDEVVVIGYGVQKKSDKTGAVAQVTSDEMTGGALTDPLQAIQGQIAGVTITKKGGDPNAGFVVKIRGASGFDSNTQPLYVVDGVPGVDPTTIAPEDIETFNILKDAASTAIYGSQGSNGVILITTKSGTANTSQLNFNVKVSADQTANRLDLMSADELRNFAADNGLNLVDGGADTDWQDEIFRTGITTSYNMNYSGGSDRTTYYASVTQAKWTGILKGTEKERTIGKINLSHEAIENRLTISGSMSGTFEQNDYEDYNGYGLKDIFYQAYSRNPTDPVYNDDGTFYQIERAFNYVNPIATINEVQNIRDAKRFYGNMKSDLIIFDGLTATLNLGYTRDDSENQVFEPRDSWASTTSGKARRVYNNQSKKLLESYFTYYKTFGYSDLNAVLGYSWQEINGDGFQVEATDANSDYMGADNLSSLVKLERDGATSYRYMSRLIGFFGRVQYNYDSKYYASASLRRDGSTKFGENNKWGWFPTAAVGWTINREDFMQNAEFISNLKLRASYGISGNQEIGEYRSQQVRRAFGIATDPETGAQVISFPPEWNSNPDLKWEQTSEINLGLDFGFINNRLSGSLELYRKMTTDLLGQFPVPVPPNVAQYTWGNSGKMENKGIELLLQAYPVSKSNFKWRTNLNIAHNQQIMIDLGDFASESGVRREGLISGRGLTSSWVIGIREGESLGAFYLPVYAGLSDGKMAYKSKTGGYTDNIADAEREIVGTALPFLELGWSNTLTFYENWSLDFSFRSMLGNKVFNVTRMMFDYPGEFPTLNRLPEAIDWYEQGRISSPPLESDYYVEDASFLRLDYLSLNYDFFPENIEWMKKLSISLSSNNLFVLTNYSGIDPETSIDGLAFGIDQYNTYPKTRTFTVGINATF